MYAHILDIIETVNLLFLLTCPKIPEVALLNKLSNIMINKIGKRFGIYKPLAIQDSRQDFKIYNGKIVPPFIQHHVVNSGSTRVRTSMQCFPRLVSTQRFMNINETHDVSFPFIKSRPNLF